MSKPPPNFNPRFTEDGRFMFFDDEEVPVAVEDAAHPYRAGAAAPAKMTRLQWLRCKLGWHRYEVIGLGGTGTPAIYQRCRWCKEETKLVLTHTMMDLINDYLARWRQRRKQS
jgi:hypothetical protein